MNLLIILLDPISRSHFNRAMPFSTETLQKLNFTNFTKYTAVGPNSGPNQAALYAGTRLGSRNGIHGTSNETEWLWDHLRKSGYVTLKGEDGCIENSNMLQSLTPNTTHGEALNGLFCFDAFARPNCIGPDAAAHLLLSYGKEFMQTYEILRKSNSLVRWASFMHFTDSHEDTMLLASTIDEQIALFLDGLDDGVLNSTAVLLCSDHGLHYGPIFQTKKGRIEATQPILYMRLPRRLHNEQLLRQNADQFITAYDVHRTLLALTGQSKTGGHSGLSIMEVLPSDRKSCQGILHAVPSYICSLQNERSMD